MKLYNQIKIQNSNKQTLNPNNSNSFKINYLKDIIAGIIVALVSIPISMGYAQIAGLPPVYGLYGSLIPILIFGLLTTSSQFIVGVDAMPAAMVGGLAAELGIMSESPEALMLSPAIAFLVAIWFIVFYFINAGRIIKYISTPVMSGFISGVSITIILMQIPKLFGGSAGTGELIHLTKNIITNGKLFNLPSFVLGVSTIVIILVFKKIAPKIPMTVIMMGVGALLQIFVLTDDLGVKTLPEVAGGLPEFVVPNLKILSVNAQEIIIRSLSIAAVIMAQTLLATGNYAAKSSYEINTKSELLSYAGMNMSSAFTGCCPINGSVSRTGIAYSFGGKSQIMSVSASATMLLVLLFFTPLLHYLPVPVLTAIVICALIGIIDFSMAARLLRSSKTEFFIFLISLFAVPVFGTVYGVMIGCIISFAEVAITATRPFTAFVGRIPGQGNFFVLERNSLAVPIKNTIIYRFNGKLFFANIDRFQNDIMSAVKEDTKQIIVDARGIDSVDITAVDRLLIINETLRNKGISFYFTEHSGHLNDMIKELGGGILLENGTIRRTISLALRDAGIRKPYPLENEESDTAYTFTEEDDKLSEFEWAFGEGAASRLEKLAEIAARKIIEEVHNNDFDIDVLSTHELETDWGKIGLFDENEFWDYLEMKLEQMSIDENVTTEQLSKVERLIEARRLEGEKRLKELSPHALDQLNIHKKSIHLKLKNQFPNEYAHIHNERKEYLKNIQNK